MAGSQIYFDNASTTPVDKRVLEDMLPYFSIHFGNPSSLHDFGDKAHGALDNAREQVASLIGANDEDMATAINRVIELNGGIVVTESGILRAELPLTLGGYVNLGPIKEANQRLEKINQVLKELGCSLPDPFLTLQTIPGPSLPFFRITLQGFVNLKNQRVVDLIVE